MIPATCVVMFVLFLRLPTMASEALANSSVMVVGTGVTVGPGQYCISWTNNACQQVRTCRPVTNAYFILDPYGINCVWVCNTGYKKAGFLVSNLCIPVSYDGYDGLVKIPGVGEYCFHSVNENPAELYPFFADIHNNACGACFPVLDPAFLCPWTCGAGVCILSADPNNLDIGLGEAMGFCAGGCLCKGQCQEIPNGVLTGSGVMTGNGYSFAGSTSCPFACNAGFIKSASSCSACPPGQYAVNNTCIPCQACDSGYWIDGCTGPNPGVCTACTNY